MFSILMTLLTDKPLILQGEVWLRSLLGLKGLITNKVSSRCRWKKWSLTKKHLSSRERFLSWEGRGRELVMRTAISKGRMVETHTLIKGAKMYETNSGNRELCSLVSCTLYLQQKLPTRSSSGIGTVGCSRCGPGGRSRNTCWEGLLLSCRGRVIQRRRQQPACCRD